MSAHKQDICSILAYLIGVKERNFFGEEGANGLLRSAFEELDRKPCAQIIRDLCTLRLSMILNHSQIQSKFRNDGYNIYTLGSLKLPSGQEIELIPVAVLNRLRNNRVNIYLSRPDVYEYLMLIHQELRRQLQMPVTKKLLPAKISWEYICDIILFPPDVTKKTVLKCVSDYYQNRRQYPYGCYLNWEGCDGNILNNDDDFLQRLYERHEDRWQAYGDNALKDFLEKHASIYGIVDCATTDLAALRDLWQQLERQHTAHIYHILLLCPKVMRAKWEDLADIMMSVTLHEVGEENPPGGDDWHRILVDTISNELFTVNCPLLLITSDTSLFQYLHDYGILETEFLVVTGQAYETKWAAVAQEDHLYQMPEVVTDYADKSAIAREQLLYHLAAYKLPSLPALVDQAVLETPFSFTEGEKSRLYQECARGLTLSVGANGTLCFQMK